MLKTCCLVVAIATKRQANETLSLKENTTSNRVLKKLMTKTKLATDADDDAVDKFCFN